MQLFAVRRGWCSFLLHLPLAGQPVSSDWPTAEGIGGDEKQGSYPCFSFVTGEAMAFVQCTHNIAVRNVSVKI